MLILIDIDSVAFIKGRKGKERIMKGRKEGRKNKEGREEGREDQLSTPNLKIQI